MAAKKIVLKATSVIETQSPVAYDGLILVASPGVGISGWVTSSQPADRIRLELMQDGVFLHEFFAIRKDQAGDASDDGRFDFALAPQDIASLDNLAADIASGRLGVHVAGSDFQVPHAADLVVTRPPENDTVTFDVVRNHDLFDHLGQLKANCGGLLSLPLRPRQDQLGGYIEAICFDDRVAGLYWFIGWKYASNIVDTSAVLVDEKKFSAAFSIASFPREDLPAGAHGIIGVIRSEWRPTTDSRPIVYYGDDAEYNLRCVSELRTLSKGDFLAQLQWARQRAPRNSWDDLFALITEQGSWVANSASRPDVHLAVDRVIVLDGCGCFVSGWALSFVQPVVSFALKFGSEIVTVDPESLKFVERSDLAHAFPGAEHIQSRAGFHCFFGGSLDMRLSEPPQIKAILENGQSVVFPIDIKQVRRLGYSEPIETLVHFYPSIQHMGFFGRVAGAVRENYRRMVSEVVVHRLAKRDACLIIACPDNVADAHLVLDQAMRNAPKHLPAGWGIVLAIGPKVSQGWLPSMMISAEHDLADRLSVIGCRKPSAITLCLPEILSLTGADRFAVVGGDSVLSDAGWAAMRELDRSDLEDVVFLETMDPLSERSVPESASSFAWNADSFKANAARLPVLLDEQLCRKDFLDVPSSEISGATSLLRRLMPSRMASLINMDARKRNATEAQSPET